MLLEITLSRDDDNFGEKGSKVLINDSYVVGITSDDGGRAIIHVDLSDQELYTKLYTEETYEKWYALRLNI